MECTGKKVFPPPPPPTRIELSVTLTEPEAIDYMTKTGNVPDTTGGLGYSIYYALHSLGYRPGRDESNH